MNRRIIMSVITAVIVASSAAQAVPVQDLHGITVDGYPVLCRGMACGYLLNEWKTPRTNQTKRGDGGGHPITLTKKQFCEKLKAKAPHQCDAEDPPSVPILDPSWKGNGCGTGGITDWLLGHAGDLLDIPGWTKDLDNPLPGVSFLNACNAHDQCYYGGGPRGGPAKKTCDTIFSKSMNAVCEEVPSYLSTTCGNVADMYKAAVENDGNDAWETNHDLMECAKYAKDMEDNGCNQ